MSRTPFTCDGNHATLTQSEQISHNTRPCRDDITKAALNAYQRQLRAKKKAAAEARTPTPVVPEEYVDHFAADTVADAAAEKETAPPKPGPPARVIDVASLGAARRLRSLLWLGYTPKELAHETGLSADSVWWLMIAPPTRIQYRTAELVDATFKRLRVQPRSLDATTTEGAAATRSRAIAELHAWAGPYDWDDIDFAACRPRNTHGHRNPATLAKAIAEAKLDAPTIPATPEVAQQPARELEIANQLRHSQILLDEAKAALKHEKSEHAEVAETLTARTKEFNAEYKLYTDKATTALAEVARLEAALAARPAAGTLESFDLLTDEHTALAADMSITIEPTPSGGIRLTLPSHLLAR